MKTILKWILALSGWVVALLLLVTLGLSSTMRSAAPALAAAEAPMMVDEERVAGGVVGAPPEALPPPAPMKLGLRRGAKQAEGFGNGAVFMDDTIEGNLAKPGPEPETPSVPSRAWFPETFLFEPRVVTDDSGQATVPLRVPDRLTTWRVLALAHTRTGAQAGAVTSFLGTLPTYVDPVIPGFLMAGDVVRLPIQAVNTTSDELTAPLRLEATGASIGDAPGTVRLPAEGSRVEYATLRAERPGRVTLKVALGDTDAVVRSVEVMPTGRPVSVTRGGTLAAPRTFELDAPADAQPQGQRVRLLVYPGALAVLRSELAAAAGRGGAADDAYSLLLAGRAEALLRSLGGEVDPESLRILRLLATQRALRLARAPDTATAALLTEAALSHPDVPLLSRLGERLAATVAAAQRPDGTCQGGDGWTLQRLLVTTADCVQAVRAGNTSPAAKRRAAAVTVRAAGAFERYADQVQDGYTAAAILAGGGASGAVAEKLKARVLEAIQQREDGARVLPVEADTQRPDGQRPSEAEATALAVLALEGDARAPLADLGAALLGRYSPAGGWGDGRTNLACLRAVLALFKDPVPPNVRVTLQLDGKTLTEGTLDAQALREVLALEAAAEGAAGRHTWSVRAEPAVPGLGFSLVLQSWVPWKKEVTGGLELSLTTTGAMQVGQPVEVDVAAAVPASTPVRIRHALPAGVQPDTASLETLVSAGAVSRYETEDGAVTLEVPGLPPGNTFKARYRVIPTLAGMLHAPASSIAPQGREELVSYLPQAPWTVR